ncbi:hypothetical protein B0J12DRAFT_90491 [Macrophomina phaseolina]|uniref:Uncharacterized protein n=1 Tax=Macrophomina phaseolina TaxID=35725 RepID=A0ABQ8GAZ9_9PEZI|nr:hypothetical protein B0J12DRAFT_90491 [Macrophomina phaseolina]
MPSSAGQKVNDPTAQIPEGAGIITNDSLAGESVKNDGSFGAGNSKAGVTSQSSAGTTTNTTDTSAARTLDPAPDAETRDAQNEWNEQSQMNAGRGLGKDAGRGPTYNTQDKSTGSADASGGPGYTTGGDSANAGVAPTAFSAGKLHEKDQKPKGKNITEGDIPDNAPNASFNGEVGTDKDPGRVAEQGFQRHAQQSGVDATAPKDKSQKGDHPYSALEETSA